MMTIKEGPIFWALDKEASVVQRTYGVLLPQILLLYTNEEDFRSDWTKPLTFFDFQKCLAIQPTDQCQDLFAIVLMMVPGGLCLLGYSAENERTEWMEVMNEAMDVEVESAELRDAINWLQTVPEEYSQKDGDKSKSQSSSPTSFPSPSQVIEPQVPRPQILPNNEAVTFSCPPFGLLDSPMLDSPIEVSPTASLESCPIDCLDEVAAMLDGIHPTLFNETRVEERTASKPSTQKRVEKARVEDAPIREKKPVGEAEAMINQFLSLNKMLISQEAVKELLTNSCSKLRSALDALYHRLRSRGISMDFAIPEAPSTTTRQKPNEGEPRQAVPKAVEVPKSSGAVGFSRRRQHQVRRPERTPALVSDDDQLASSPSLDNSDTESISSHTLIADSFGNLSTTIESSPVDVVCSHCLRTLAAGILEIGMNLIVCETPPSSETLRRVHALATCFYSYLSGHIAAIRSRTSLPNDVLVTELAKLATDDLNASAIVMELVENEAAEVCGQILEERGTAEQKATTTAHLVNGLASEWIRTLPERVDVKWMLPGYIAACLMLYRLSEMKSTNLEDSDWPIKLSPPNGSSTGGLIDDVLDALSTALALQVSPANDFKCAPNNLHLQLGLEFKSLCSSLLTQKCHRNVLEVFLPETSIPRDIEPDRLLSSKLRSPNEAPTLEKVHSSFAKGALNDNTPLRQSAPSSRPKHSSDGSSALSNSLPQGRLQGGREGGIAQEQNRDVDDQASVISALRREHEEEKQRMMQDVILNWFHRDYYDAYTIQSEQQLKSLHAQISRIYSEKVANLGPGRNTESAALLMSNFQETIRESHVILLDEVENAISIFSKFVNSAVDRQEDLEDDDFNKLSAQVPEALAGLAAAVNDLRARLLYDLHDDENNDFVGGDGIWGFDRRSIPSRGFNSSLGFTINLRDTEDPDEISESEI